jgi:hypothetical protein
MMQHGRTAPFMDWATLYVRAQQLELLLLSPRHNAFNGRLADGKRVLRLERTAYRQNDPHDLMMMRPEVGVLERTKRPRHVLVVEKDVNKHQKDPAWRIEISRKPSSSSSFSLQHFCDPPKRTFGGHLDWLVIPSPS